MARAILAETVRLKRQRSLNSEQRMECLKDFIAGMLVRTERELEELDREGTTSNAA